VGNATWGAVLGAAAMLAAGSADAETITFTVEGLATGVDFSGNLPPNGMTPFHPGVIVPAAILNNAPFELTMKIDLANAMNVIDASGVTVFTGDGAGPRFGSAHISIDGTDLNFGNGGEFFRNFTNDGTVDFFRFGADGLTNLGNFTDFEFDFSQNVDPTLPPIFPFNLMGLPAGELCPLVCVSPEYGAGIEIRSTGTPDPGFGSIGFNVTSLVVTYDNSAVPEPASWLLTIIGVGLAGGFARSKPRVAGKLWGG